MLKIITGSISLAALILTVIINVITNITEWQRFSTIDQKLLPISKAAKLNTIPFLTYIVVMFFCFFAFLLFCFFYSTFLPAALNIKSRDFQLDILLTSALLWLYFAILSVIYYFATRHKQTNIVLSNGWILLNPIDSEHFTVALDESMRYEKIITIQELSKYALTIKTIKTK